LLQQQLVIEAASGWELSCIPKFDVDAIRKKDPEADLPEAPPTYAFPALAIPSPVNPGDKPLFPEAYFSLFADQELATVPKTTELAASVIRDAIVDTIDSLDFNRDKVAKYLIELDCYWSLDTFTKRAITFDKFKDHVGDRIMYKSEDMVIDAIFSMLFKLPTPQHKLVYFHSVITTCCKAAPSAIAPSLGRAIRTIYKSIHVMDLELSYRFMDWFSHHMSNFEFRWRWAEWQVVLPNVCFSRLTVTGLRISSSLICIRRRPSSSLQSKRRSAYRSQSVSDRLCRMRCTH
jgi:nuclear cap-binding protein subunit 1